MCLKSRKQAFVTYTYALTPVMDSSTRVDWRPLTTDTVEAQHVYLHQLQPGDTLSSIAAKHRKSYTVAIVLSNVTNSLELAPEFSEGAVKSKKNSLPMILISSEDAGRLRDLLGHHDPGEVYARIEPKNQPHVDLSPPSATGSTRGSNSPEVLRPKRSGEQIRADFAHM